MIYEILLSNLQLQLNILSLDERNICIHVRNTIHQLICFYSVNCLILSSKSDNGHTTKRAAFFYE